MDGDPGAVASGGPGEAAAPDSRRGHGVSPDGGPGQGHAAVASGGPGEVAAPDGRPGQGMSLDGGPGHGAEADGGPGHGAEADAGPGHGAEADAGPGHGSASVSASSAWLEGMDVNSSYLLKIRMLGNPETARKEIKAFYFEKVIDSDFTNYEDLVDSIIVQYPPRYLEVVHVQYYDDVLKMFPEIKSDQDLLSMFEKHIKTKMVHMFFAYCDPSQPYEPITDYHFDVPLQPNNNVDQDEENYLINPIPENEHVGIDEENMYFEEEPTALNMVLFVDKEKDKDYAATDDESEDKSGDESEDEIELEEEEEMHEANHAPNVEYDKADPPMTEGSKYPNMDEFKLALSQHAIKHELRRRKVAKKLDGLILPHIIKKLNAMTRELNLEVVESSEEVAEVTALGGSGFRFVVNLQERTCSCRQWQVSGLPCKHALAFITSLSHAHIRHYVDLYYSIDKLRAAYAQLIPAMPDKTQWPKSDHGFFMHPPLLKATAGRPKTERYKGCNEKKRKNGKHLCPICKEKGHHWHNCKKGNPDDIAAMMAVRGPPKKRPKIAKASESSIVPCEDGAPTRMCFPPSQNLETTTKKKGKDVNSSAGTSKSSLENTSNKKRKGANSKSVGSKRSRTGSNQPELGKKECAQKLPVVPVDSPAMCTRSKNWLPASPAMNTRSKRRLSL